MALRIEDFEIIALSLRMNGMAGFQASVRTAKATGRSAKPASQRNTPSILSHDEIGFAPVKRRRRRI